MYHDSSLLDRSPDQASPKGKIDVEICLHDQSDTELLVSETETSRKFRIPRYGVKILVRNGIYATLRLTERRAIEYNLV